MISLLKKLFRRKRSEIPLPQRRFRRIRLTYHEEEPEESEGKLVVETMVERPKKRKKKEGEKKKKNTNKKKKEEEIEDVEGAIALLIEASKKLICPFCKARLLSEIHYLYKYYYKTKLLESGIPHNEVDSVYEERYAKIVQKKIEKLKEELKVGDFELKEATKEKAKETFALT